MEVEGNAPDTTAEEASIGDQTRTDTQAVLLRVSPGREMARVATSGAAMTTMMTMGTDGAATHQLKAGTVGGAGSKDPLADLIMVIVLLINII